MLRPRRAEPTETSRLEAFSDGVFAVAITLLALDLSRIHADPSQAITLAGALGANWPTLLAFAASFAFVGVAWTNHHHVFVRVMVQSRALNWANLLLLAGVTIVPWATSILAQSLGDAAGDHGRQEILLYAAVTSFGALTWGLVFHVLATSPELLEDPTHAKGFVTDRSATLVGLITTAIAAFVGYFWSPLIATGLFLALPVFYAVASEGFESHESV
ncbi:MAG: TMEM175 family protein [Chloroflexota bacterium]